MPLLRPAPALLTTLAALLCAALSPAPVHADPAVPARGSAYMGTGVLAHDGQNGTPRTGLATQTEGVDVASYQGDVAWPTLLGSGVRWAYTKATEGTYYTNPSFAQQYNGSYDAGMVRGAYHFATPDTTGGAAQADYFVDHGGGGGTTAGSERPSSASLASTA
ncbi:GH25 family lysozyme, partial [Streptomyces sp. NPDC007162]|uniref:GH25 family lysozyme n=1 Tax=Streptomyces sp. NPDC007162 TaxID=3156917 RepID=UPI0033D5212F